MGTTRQGHPTRGQLRDFAHGRGSAADRARVESHVSTCDNCAALLGTVPDDTLMGRLRDSGTVGPAGGDTGPHAPGVPSAEMPPELIDHPRYRLTRRLGSGGMGVVFHAVHRLMEREVALKVISAPLMRHPAVVERFKKEFVAVGKLNHPHIVAAHDAEQVGGLYFLVMEYVDGVSLDRFVKKNGPLSAAVACLFIRQAAQALQHAHEQGLVHRDIKPQNLMVTRKGHIKVLDFGLARVAEEAARPAAGARPLTAIGTVLGTPDYIAPEQVGDSHAVDIRADIYSLGCTLYFLLTGRPPFPEGSALEKALSHVEGSPEPLRVLRPEMPPELAAVIEKMMAKKPDARFATPGEVAAALTPFAKQPAGEAARPAPPPPAPPPPPPPPADLAPTPSAKAPPPRRRLPVGRWRLFAAIAAGVAFLGVVIGVILARMGTPTPGGTAGPGGPKPRILIVLPYNRFYAPDYRNLMHGLAGQAEVTVASWNTGPLIPVDGTEEVKATVRVSASLASQFDAVIFSGGPKVEELSGAKLEEARRLLEGMLALKKPVAGLCGGSAVLAKAGILKDKQATGYPDLHWVLKSHGAKVSGKSFEWDGDIMTGRDSAATGELAEAILRRLRAPR